MKISNGNDWHYIGFLQKKGTLDIQFQVRDVLKLNFDLDTHSSTNEWSARVIEAHYFRIDTFDQCFSAAMALLRNTKLNQAQNEAIQYLRNLPNGLDLITGPAATKKTELLIFVAQLFLYNLTDSNADITIIISKTIWINLDRAIEKRETSLIKFKSIFPSWLTRTRKMSLVNQLKTLNKKLQRRPSTK